MSVYLTERDTLILHIPRTGGTFVKRAVELLGVPHEQSSNPIDWHGRRHFYRPADRAVCFVRHPVAWIESWWRFHVAEPVDPSEFPGDGCPWEEIALIHRAVGTSDFHLFVSRILDQAPGIVGRLFGRYTIDCDAIYRIEDLETRLADLIDCPVARIQQLPYQQVARPHRIAEWNSTDLDRWKKTEAEIIGAYYEN